jgi:hypothetical protein
MEEGVPKNELRNLNKIQKELFSQNTLIFTDYDLSI